MKPALKSVRLPSVGPLEKKQVEASWLNKNWSFVNIHNHTIDNFRARMAERKARAEAQRG
jgi:hypothetical protein